MPTMTDRRSVAANSVVSNVFSGKLFEFADRNYFLRLYATAAAVGLNLTFQVGTDVIVDDSEVNAQNRLPIPPDDLVSNAAARRGDKIVINWRNTTGAAIIGFLKLDLLPI